MNDTARQLADGLQHFGTILAWLAGGMLLGALLAHWQAPGSQTALVASALLVPGTIVLGWMLMFPLALLMLPFLIPRFIRWLREPMATPATPREATAPRRATAAGWVFVLAAIPTSLAAGLIAGAPFTYLLAGLLYGLAARHSAALQDVRPG